MSANTICYVKATVPIEQWFEISALTLQDAEEELRKQEGNIIQIIKSTYDASEVDNDTEYFK